MGLGFRVGMRAVVCGNDIIGEYGDVIMLGGMGHGQSIGIGGMQSLIKQISILIGRPGSDSISSS